MCTFVPCMKNYIGQTLLITICVIGFLLLLTFSTREGTIAGWPWRKIDILSAIRPTAPAVVADSLFLSDSTSLGPAIDTTALPATDSVAALPPPLPPADSSAFGRMLEDYSPGQHGLQRFFAAIDSARVGQRTVRVAFFGDSFVEGDILLGDLRDTLQSLWGGEGVGFVPITSEVARFKRTLVHKYDHWRTHSIVKKGPSAPPFGINGFSYQANEGAFFRYDGADYFRHTRRWSQVRLFYTAPRPVPMIWQIEGLPPVEEELPATRNQVQQWQKQSPQPDIRAFAARFPNPGDSLVLYGVALESGPGFYLDNFSVRGNTGGKLKQISPAMAQRFNALQKYDLVVVQLGLNAVTPSLDNIKWYRNELDQTFAHLRQCFPSQPFLVIGVPDRAGKVDTEIATMISVPYIVRMQRDLARKYGFLFYDIFRGMGGYGAMVRYANDRPALANKDFTHLTHEGGKRVGRMLAKVFLDEQIRYAAQRVKD
jgi:GDSL-like Lipase/Acylhydrolase family